MPPPVPPPLPKGTSAKAILLRGDQLGGHASSKHLDRPAADLHKGFDAAKPNSNVMSKFAQPVDMHKATAMVRNAPEYRAATGKLKDAPVGSSASIRIKVPSGQAPRAQVVTRQDPKCPQAMATATIFAKIIKNKAGLMFQTVVPEPKPQAGGGAKKLGMIEFKAAGAAKVAAKPAAKPPVPAAKPTAPKPPATLATPPAKKP